MTHHTASPRKGISSLMGGLFGRKPAATPVLVARPPAPKGPEDLQAWPWTPLHDVSAERFGPLTRHAVTGESSGWRDFV